MASTDMPLLPGSMTVPPWFGWGEVALVVVLAVLLGVAAFVALAAGRAAGGRSEWDAWLEGRSGPRAQESDTPSR